MIAAPSNYPFGTKMHIPGIGTVAVHDRGGAIQTAGKNLKHDRLDIWMGRGDEGLSRALTWGRRVLKVTVYGVDPSIREEVTFKSLVLSEGYSRRPVRPPMFPVDIWNLSHGEEVVKLQKTLAGLGYFDEPITGFYGPETRDAVYRFQSDHDIFTDASELGAGHTGPQTRISLEKAFVERRKTLLPGITLGRGSQGQNVSKLQQILRELGYDVRVTGVFDEQTQKAILTFQKMQKIVKNEKEHGAGYFGHKTMAALEKQYTESVVHANATVIEVPNYLVQDLSLNATGEAVRQLQSELARLNFLRIEPTGNYGPVTAHAVFKFQQSQGLVRTLDDSGAQVFGPATRERLNQIIAERFYQSGLITMRKKALSLISLAK
jgi:peptidoglycan hydrolase-like protein with peptidoglycan-binding domain